MMIDLKIHVEDGRVAYSYHDDKVTMTDIGVLLYHLNYVKKMLGEIEFENDFEFTEYDWDDDPVSP